MGAGLTAISTSQLLIASHIVPWRHAEDVERLDPYNSILLSPLYDSLFDKYLVSFQDDGMIILSAKLPKEEATRLGITGNEVIQIFGASKKYLKRHREMFIETLNRRKK